MFEMKTSVTTFKACVWDPAMVKINTITAASEAAALILSVDETKKHLKLCVNNHLDALPEPKVRGREIKSH